MAARLIPWLVVAMLAACGCGNESNPLVGTYQLRGQVTDLESGNGVGGAKVTFTSQTGYQDTTTTGGDGKYYMTVTSDSAFGQVRADKDGYVSDEKTVYFDSGTRRIDLGLRQIVTP